MIVAIKRGRIFLLLIYIIISVIVFGASSARGSNSPQDRIELSQEAVSKYVLENGLIILAKESRSQDLTAINIKIKAGVRLEGEYSGSGISHFVEHMVFKGTTTRGVGDIEKEIKSYGGFISGAVSHDLTSFDVTVPSRYMKETLSLLKDMLLNAAFENGEVEKEREVILREMKLNRDEPNARLSRLLHDTAYIGHPYKYPIIGYEGRFKDLRRDDLINYYNKMYVPNKIVIAVAGGIDSSEAISAVESEFRDFRLPRYMMEGQIEEPMQMGERRYQEEMPIGLSYLAMGFHSTSILDKDLFALDILSMIMGRGDNSRLNAALVKEKTLAHSISSWNYTPLDPGLFVIRATLDKENLGLAEKSIRDEIDKVKNDDIKDEELEGAKRMALSDYLFSRETLEEEASDLAANETLTGDYEFSRRYVDGIQAASREDLKRAANTYLRNDNLTVVTLVPAGFKSEEVKDTAAPGTEPITKKEVLSNGLRILIREAKKSPTISISVACLGGLSVEEGHNNGISNMTARMLLKGTGTKKEEDIKGAFENRGGAITPFSGFNSFGIDLTLLKIDLDFALETLKDILTDSSFQQSELDKEKVLTSAMMKEEDADIFERGGNLLRRNLFGRTPYGLRNIGEEESVKSLTRDAMINFYRTYCIPNNMVISISGDIEYGSVAKKIKDLFGDMKKKIVPTIPSIDMKLDKVTSQTLEMEKDQSLVLVGFKTTNVLDRDRYPLHVLGSLLSGSSGRLFSSLRDKRSLAYTLGCVQKFGLDTGYFIFYVATTKDKIHETKMALSHEIDDIKQRVVSDEEMALAKMELHTSHKIKMQTNDFFSHQTALDELYGLGYDDLYKYEKEIAAVSKEDVKRVANKYFDLEKCAQVIISSSFP